MFRSVKMMSNLHVFYVAVSEKDDLSRVMRKTAFVSQLVGNNEANLHLNFR